jgi:hypothetical protein
VTILHWAPNVCTLDLVVPDEFVAMVADANRVRAAVRELGLSGSDIDSNIRARLHALLDNSRLAAQQAAQLEFEYFPPRRHP